MPRFFNLKLRNPGLGLRLALFGLLTALPLAALSISNAEMDRRAEIGRAMNRARESAQAGVAKHAEIIKQTQTLLEVLAQSLSLGPAQSNCAQLLKKAQSNHPEYTGLGLVAPDGHVLCSSINTPATLNVADRSWFKAAIAAKSFVLGDYLIGRQTRKPTLPAAVPVLDHTGAISGVLYAGINLDAFQQVVQRSDRQGSTSLILDGEGRLLAADPPHRALIGRHLSTLPLVSALLSRKSGSLIKPGLDGQQTIFGFANVPASRLIFAIGYSEAAALARGYATLRLHLLLLAGAGLATALAGWLFAHRFIIRGLRQLSQMIDRRSKGGQGARAADLPLTGELRDFGAAFDAMSDELQSRESALIQARSALEAVIQASPVAIFTRDVAGVVMTWNPAAEQILGYSASEIIGSLTPGLLEDKRQESAHLMRRALAQEPFRGFETKRLHKDGRLIDVSLSVAALLDAAGAVIGTVYIFEDISERKRNEARIAHMARHDALTDLPNRAFFAEKIDQALGRVRRQGEALAVLSLDLDRFKAVNDTLGHAIGDALLCEVAHRLRACSPEAGTVARLGGDEFAILCPKAEQAEQVAALARKVIDALERPYRLQGHDVIVGASIGIALAPGDGLDKDDLLKNSDLALYRAKTEGRGTARFFEANMDARAQARRAMELDLRAALARGEFELNYQPVLNLRTGAATGAEALLRWRRPERGVLLPLEFIPIAEEIGLMPQLGEWVLREACAQAALWPKTTKLAVNVSPTQFKARNFLQVVISALASSGLSSNRLELEITESVLLEESEGTLATLHQLRSLGVGISLDDFGTGYASLSYLRSFPFDKVKIDQSFVRELTQRSNCEAIVRAIAALGGSLGMTTAAEGVETEDQLQQVRADGCTEAQGFLFSPAVPGSRIQQFFAPPSIRRVS